MKIINAIFLSLILSGCTSFPAAVLPVIDDGIPNTITKLESKQIYLSGVKTRLENTSVGQMTIGNACVNEKEFKWANNDTWDEKFRDAMISEFAKYNYNIPLNTLEFKNQEDADILIGARMTDMVANICNAPNGIKGDAVITIEWTIFDKATDQTSLINTFGKGHVPRLNKEGAQQLYRDASADAARNLMATKEFYSIVKK